MKVANNNSMASQISPAKNGQAASMKPIDGGSAGMNSGANVGKETVGDIANRVANAAGSAGGTRRVQGQGSPNLDKDAFFKLMLTHIKNQDPTSPLKSHEMAAQLAQFSSLEQMSNIKEVLSEMNKGQSSTGQMQSMELIGKVVSGDASKIDRAKGDKLHSNSFALSESADTVQISIKGPDGKVVKNIEMKNVPKGTVKFDWDGKDIEGRELAAGSYKVDVAAKSVNGNKIAVDMKFKGQVTGIQFTEKGPIVFVGSKQIPLKEIKQIEVAEEKNSFAQSMPGMSAMPGMNPMALAGAPVGGPKHIAMDQLDPSQREGLEQALSALKGGGAGSSPISDPTQEILASAVANQNMKNQNF